MEIIHGNAIHELKATLSNDAVEKFIDILKEEISKINDKLEGKIHQLCRDKSFLQEQIKELKKQNRVIAASCEETEQYSRRFCLEIPDPNLDRGHRIGKPYFDKIKKEKCKSIIVRLNTFRHQALLYRAKKDIKQKRG